MKDRDGHLYIARFPSKGDEYNTVLWEALALTLADQAGIAAPAWRLETVPERSVLRLRRFDREEGMRLPSLSAVSMLGAQDNEPHSIWNSYLPYASTAPRRKKISARSGCASCLAS